MFIFQLRAMQRPAHSSDSETEEATHTFGMGPFDSFSDVALQDTWKAVLKGNLEQPSMRDTLAKRMWPKACVYTNLTSVSTTTKRGKAPRAYPRKAVVKTCNDSKASKIKIGLHQLAAYIAMERKPYPKEQASHYGCDDDRCINPGHLVFESGTANTTRGCCKQYKSVPGYKCPHTPTCPGCNSCFVQ